VAVFETYGEPGIVNMPNGRRLLINVRPALKIDAKWLEVAQRQEEARRGALRQSFNVWEIKSDSRPVTYYVRTDGEEWTCTCPGYAYHRKCKHIERCKKVQENE